MKGQAGLVEIDLRVFITFLSLFTLNRTLRHYSRIFFSRINNWPKEKKTISTIGTNKERFTANKRDISRYFELTHSTRDTVNN